MCCQAKATCRSWRLRRRMRSQRRSTATAKMSGAWCAHWKICNDAIRIAMCGCGARQLCDRSVHEICSRQLSATVDRAFFVIGGAGTEFESFTTDETRDHIWICAAARDCAGGVVRLHRNVRADVAGSADAERRGSGGDQAKAGAAAGTGAARNESTRADETAG